MGAEHEKNSDERKGREATADSEYHADFSDPPDPSDLVEISDISDLADLQDVASRTRFGNDLFEVVGFV